MGPMGFRVHPWVSWNSNPLGVELAARNYCYMLSATMVLNNVRS